MTSKEIEKERRKRQAKTKEILREPVITTKEPLGKKIFKYILITTILLIICGGVTHYVQEQFNLQRAYILHLENTIEKNKWVIAQQSQLTKELSSELLSNRIVITQEEKELLERLVEAEAGSEPYDGKIAVVNVVFNRLHNQYYPNSIREVVFQPYQFTPAHTGKINNIKPSPASINAVEDALNGKEIVPNNTLFFVALDIASDFTVPNSRPRIMSIGNHTFYR